MPKLISDHTKNVKIDINLGLVSHEIIIECKFALESFDFTYCLLE